VCVRDRLQRATESNVIHALRCTECTQLFTMQDTANVVPPERMQSVMSLILGGSRSVIARLCSIVDLRFPSPQPQEQPLSLQAQAPIQQPPLSLQQPQEPADPLFNTSKDIGRIFHYAWQHNEIPGIAALVASAQEIGKKSNRCTGCTMKGHSKNNAHCPAKHISPDLLQAVKAKIPITPTVKHTPPIVLQSIIIPSLPPTTTATTTTPSTGTGFGGSTTDKHIPQISSSQGQFDILALGMIRALIIYFDRPVSTSVYEYAVLSNSNFIPDITTLVRNDSITDIHLRKKVYTPLFKLLRTVSEDYTLNQLLVPDLRDAFTNLNKQASVFMNLHAGAGSADAEIDSDTMDVMTIVFDISDTHNIIQNNTAHLTSPVVNASSDYVSRMREMSFTEADLDIGAHLLHSTIDTDAPSSRKKIIRISKELSSMSTSLPLSRDSIVIVKVSRIRMDVLSFMITGPIDTPYAYGCFVFDIYLNSNYPEKPPMCMIRTTGGGTARFNPNLYSSGKVCMSILNTWQGPGWVPGVSTILQVIISIQSLIMVAEPYFNEPGYEKLYGTPTGVTRSQAYNSTIREYTVRYAMLSHIRGILANNAAGSVLFGTAVDEYEKVYYDAMRAHYIEHRPAIIKMVKEWGCKSTPELIREINKL